MQRRTLLLASLPCPLALVPGRGRATVVPRRLLLRHAHTGARFDGPYHDGLRHDPHALAELSLVLADTRTGASRPFDPAALDLLWEMAQRTGLAAQELPILSGYRTPATNAAVDGAEHSQHLRAGALDIQLRAAVLLPFAEAAMALRRGGVGTYAQRGFVHLDTGPVRRWSDGGSAARPATPQQDRMSRIAEAWAATRRP